MNILVVSQYYYLEPFRINEICEELVRRNNKVTVLTTMAECFDYDARVEKGIISKEEWHKERM